MSAQQAGFREGRLEGGWEDLERRRKAMAIVIAASLGIALLLWLLPLGADPSFHHRTSRSSASMGFRGLHDLLVGLGEDVGRHRRTYRELGRAEDTLLLVLDPFDHATLRKHGRSRFDHEQWSQLHSWIRAGGHAIVVLPTWEATDMGGGFESGRLRPNAARAILEEPPPGGWETGFPEVDDGSWLHRSWYRVGKDPLLHAFDEDMDSWPTPLDEWKTHRRLFAPYWVDNRSWTEEQGPEDRGPWMQFFMQPFPEGYSMRAQLGGEALLLRRSVGDGAAWVLSSGYPLSNMALAKGNTAWFVYKLIEEASAEFRRRIVFDEFSHGDSDTRGMLGWLEESGALYPILALGILFLLAAWKGLVRIGSPARSRILPRRAKEEFVVGLASLLHSQDRRGYVARSLLDESRYRLEHAPGFSYSERNKRLGLLKQEEKAMDSQPHLSYRDLRKLAQGLDELTRTKEASST